jgi:prepilin-type N-terminal cleavage/methylation domain-containing protein
MSTRITLPPRLSSNQGFTIVELLVTIVIATLFITGFFQTYLLIESQRLALVRDARANDIAYSNLRKVPSRTTISSADCPRLTQSVSPTTGLDLFGSIGYSREPSTVTSRISNSVTQQLRAYTTASNCNADLATNPIKIVSTVIYTVGGNTYEVSHATYVK